MAELRGPAQLSNPGATCDWGLTRFVFAALLSGEAGMRWRWRFASVSPSRAKSPRRFIMAGNLNSQEGTHLERQRVQASGSRPKQGDRKAVKEARAPKMEERAGTARSGSAPFSGCRNALRRPQFPVLLWKRPQVQEVLRQVIAILGEPGRGKWLSNRLWLS